MEELGLLVIRDPGLEGHSECWAGAIGGTRCSRAVSRGPVGPIQQPTSQGSPAGPGPGIVEWSLASSLHPAAPMQALAVERARPGWLQFSNPGPSQPLPQHRSCEPDDPPTAAPERLGESEGPHTECRAEDPRGQ